MPTVVGVLLHGNEVIHMVEHDKGVRELVGVMPTVVGELLLVIDRALRKKSRRIETSLGGAPRGLAQSLQLRNVVAAQSTSTVVGVLLHVSGVALTMVHSMVLVVAAPCKMAPMHDVAVTAVMLDGMEVAVGALLLGIEMMLVMVVVVRLVPVVGADAEFDTASVRCGAGKGRGRSW